MAMSVLKQLSNAVGLAALTVAAASPAVAFVLDGRETGTEYSTADVFDVDFLLNTSGVSGAPPITTVSGGTLKIGRVGSGDIFAILKVPIPVVDLVSGPPTSSSPTATAGSGWKPSASGLVEHPLDKLVSSDQFNFKLPVLGVESPVNIDLINDNLLKAKNGSGPTGAAGATAPVLPVDKEDPNLGLADGAGSVVAASTSLVYNLTGKDFTGGGAGSGDARDPTRFYGDAIVTTTDPNPSVSPDPLDPTTNPDGLAPPPDWIQAVQYEIQFDGNKFPGAFPGAALWTMMAIHASPNKFDLHKFINIVCLQIVGGPQTNCVPSSGPPQSSTPGISEPGTLAVFSVGLLALAWRRRRRRV